MLITAQDQRVHIGGQELLQRPVPGQLVEQHSAQFELAIDKINCCPAMFSAAQSRIVDAHRARIKAKTEAEGLRTPVRDILQHRIAV